MKGYDIDTDIFLQHSDILHGYNNNIFEHTNNLDSSQTGNGSIFTSGGLSGAIFVENEEMEYF